MKCAHDFAKGEPAAATDVPSGCFGGTSWPVSRDCGSRVGLNELLSLWMVRGAVIETETAVALVVLQTLPTELYRLFVSRRS